MGIFVCPKPEPRLQGSALPLKEPTQTVIKSPSASSGLNLHSPQPSSINSTFCSSFPCRDIIFSALICFPQHKVIPPSSFILLMGCFLTWTRRSPLLTAHPSLTLSPVLLGPPAAGPVCIGHQMAPTTFLEWICITYHSGSGLWLPPLRCGSAVSLEEKKKDNFST